MDLGETSIQDEGEGRGTSAWCSTGGTVVARKGEGGEEGVLPVWQGGGVGLPCAAHFAGGEVQGFISMLHDGDPDGWGEVREATVE